MDCCYQGKEHKETRTGTGTVATLTGGSPKLGSLHGNYLVAAEKMKIRQ